MLTASPQLTVRRSWLRIVHLATGAALFMLFLMTGSYMRTHFPEAYASNESIRFLYRANHVYLLFAALVHLVLGAGFAAEEGWRKHVQRIGSALMVVGTGMLIMAFFVEPATASPHRPLTAYGIFAFAAGTALQVLARLGKRA